MGTGLDSNTTGYRESLWSDENTLKWIVVNYIFIMGECNVKSIKPQ